MAKSVYLKEVRLVSLEQTTVLITCFYSIIFVHSVGPGEISGEPQGKSSDTLNSPFRNCASPIYSDSSPFYTVGYTSHDAITRRDFISKDRH
ncbi:hypothetical protein BDR04DRAFT_1109864 [Suillus decipiens]|nr:hypothetical protein BDR04DRAFT_1109864 [Suillus decipiens]